MNPVDVVVAGAQPFGLGLIDSSGKRAVYCSTLAIHVYDVSGEPKLQSILTGAYDRNILCVSMSPLNPNDVAVTINEGQHNLVLWDIAAEEATKRMGADTPVYLVQWCAATILSHPLTSPSPSPVVSPTPTLRPSHRAPFSPHACARIARAGALITLPQSSRPHITAC